MRDFSKAKRIVIKIGTNTLSKDGGVDTDYVTKVCIIVNLFLWFAFTPFCF